MSKIADAYAGWDDKHQIFCVYLEREPEDVDGEEVEPTMLRPLHQIDDDPVEARIVWDAIIHCPKDFGNGDMRDTFVAFKTKAQAERVARRAVKTLVDIKKGVGPLEGVAAQLTYASKGGKVRVAFDLDGPSKLRSKIAGAQ